MKRNQVELIKAWFLKADRDLLTIDHEFSSSNPVLETICFHSQQAVEKYLKGYLIFLDIPFRKTHELGELVTTIENKDKEISKLKLEVDQLTGYAVEIRYPDDFIELSVIDANEAKNIAFKLKEYIINKVKFD